jgi:hypothetical protein
MAPPRPPPRTAEAHGSALSGGGAPPKGVAVTLSTPLALYAVLPGMRPVHLETGSLASLVAGDAAEGCGDTLFVCLSSVRKPPPAEALARLRDVLLREVPIPGAAGVLAADCVPRRTRQLAEAHRELAASSTPSAVFAALSSAGGADGAATGVLSAALSRLTELASSAESWSDADAEALHAVALATLSAPTSRRFLGVKELCIIALTRFADADPARCLYALPSGAPLLPEVSRFARQGSGACMDACMQWAPRLVLEMATVAVRASDKPPAGTGLEYALNFARDELASLVCAWRGRRVKSGQRAAARARSGRCCARCARWQRPCAAAACTQPAAAWARAR